MAQPQESTVEIDGATIRYTTTGSGSPVVFLHGVWVGGGLWNDVVERLDGVRCVVPTWPFGAHEDPAPGADLSARAAARRIPALLEALDLSDVTLVGNDTGGGLCLAALAADHPGVERIGRLVLTNCDSYEHFPPKAFRPIVSMSRRVPPLGRAVLRLFATSFGGRYFMKAVTVTQPSERRRNEVLGAFTTSKAARADALRMTQTLEPSVTLDAVPALQSFTKPVLLAWGTEDDLFPITHAERLRDDFPNAMLQPIEHASTFVMLDQPDRLAQLIGDFAR